MTVIEVVMFTLQRIVFCLLILSLLLTNGCDEAGFPAIDSSLQSSITSRVSYAMAAYNIPGVTVGLWIKGRSPYIHSWGESNIDEGTVLDTGDAFRVGSFTNTYIATTILRMIDQGKLNFTTTIHGYFPDIPGSNQITIQHLLGMQSGLGDLTENAEYRSKYYSNPTYAYSHDEIIAMISSLPVHFEPGASTEFCSSNYYLLGKIIQVAGHSTTESLLNSYILEPKLLLKTKLPTTTSISGVHSHGYISGDDSALIDRTQLHPAFTWTAGAMTSTVGDIQDWLKILYDGELLTTALHNEQMTISGLDGSSIIGYGLGIIQWGELFGHTGYIQGYNTSAWYYPDEDAYIVVMANRYDDDGVDTAAADMLAAGIMNDAFPSVSLRNAANLPH